MEINRKLADNSMIKGGNSAKRKNRMASDETYYLNLVRVGFLWLKNFWTRDLKEARKQILFIPVGRVLQDGENRECKDPEARACEASGMPFGYFLTRHAVTLWIF